MEQDIYNWKSFLSRWNKQYDNAKFILSYLNSYTDILNAINLTDIHNPNSIDNALKEWIWLCSKLTNSLDTEFFKAHWIPIQENSYDYFMDISDEKYPIFEIHYFFFEPFKWYKKFITEDISELLLAPDTGLDLKQLLNKNDKIRWQNVDKFFEERKRLGFEGKIYVKEVSNDELIFDNKIEEYFTIKKTKTSVRILGVSSIIVGLLPFTLPIRLLQIKYKYGKPFLERENVKIIRDLVFLLRDTGMRRVESYSIDFYDSTECYLEYRDGELILSHTNQTTIKDFLTEFKLKTSLK